MFMNTNTIQNVMIRRMINKFEPKRRSHRGAATELVHVVVGLAVGCWISTS